MYTVSGAMVFAPVIAMVKSGPVVDFYISDLRVMLDTPSEALTVTPFGLLGLLVASHVVLVFSSIHGWWARLMLGSRSTRVGGRPVSPPTGDDPSRITAPSEPGIATPASGGNANPGPALGTGHMAEASPGILSFAPSTSEVRSATAAMLAELTAREQEVFMLMAHGDTNADIAEELFISEGTVKTHVKRVLSKLDMRDRTQVVVFAYEERLVVPTSGGGAKSDDAAGRRAGTGA